MSKVKITQEQADALEAVQDRGKVRSMIIRWQTGRGRWMGDEESLNELELDDLIRALYIGYEVERNYEVGDWIVDRSKTGKLIRLTEYITHLDGCENWGGITWDPVEKFWNNIAVFKSEIKRHATSEEVKNLKQKVFWNKNKRDVWEIREDDILEYLNDLYIVDSFDSEKVYLKSGIERKTDYAEPFDFVKKHFKVVAFSEDRKDV